MSQFEYVSVAIALVYSFAISRLIAALPNVFTATRRYWVHSVWLIVILLAAVSTWWQIWNLRAVEWTAVRFIWALSVPALIHVRVGLLVSARPESVESWRDHYFATRRVFFSVGIVMACNGLVIPWVMGLAPWLTPIGNHVAAAILFAISLTGLVSEDPRVHGVLATANLAMVVGFLVV